MDPRHNVVNAYFGKIKIILKDIKLTRDFFTSLYFNALPTYCALLSSILLYPRSNVVSVYIEC